MTSQRLTTDRLELRPLAAEAATALPRDRLLASQMLGATLSPMWPQAEMLEILPRQAALSVGEECFGIWVMIECESRTIIGDIGFHGPPDDSGTVELGYAVVPDRRRHGYAAEAVSALVRWVLCQPAVTAVVAGCAPSNVASIATLERARFRSTGEREGELRWRCEGEHGTD